MSATREMAVPADMPTVPGLEVEHRFVDAGGLTMHVAEAGSGEPLVMLHGWPQHWYMWRHVMAPLAEHYRLVVPDLRGLGWTDAPARGYDKETMAADVMRLLDALGLERVKLMGHDWGGWAGFLMCMHHPERFERFMVLNIPPPMSEIPPRQLLGMWRLAYQVALSTPGIGAPMMRYAPWVLRRALTQTSATPNAYTAAELDSYARKLQEPARANATVQLYRTFLTKEALPMARGRYRNVRLKTKTLLLFGTSDPVISVHLIDRPHPNADDLTVELVDNCSHFIVEEKPELVADRALEFFGEAS